MEFKQYLAQRYRPLTVKNYLCDIQPFLAFMEDAESASYQDIMAYIGHLRAQGNRRIFVILAVIKCYYHYLIAIGKRSDHPAQAIRLRDKRSSAIQLQDLFSRQELERLLDRIEHYPQLKYRNKVIMSLLVYQGLSSGEIRRLVLDDIDLESGKVYIQGSMRNNARSLKLHSNQVYWIIKYLTEDRPKFIKEETNQLIVTKQGKGASGYEIRSLIESSKSVFPNKRLNAKIIRQSVIHNLLKSGKDLRLVQAFAGHKTPSATEKYRQTGIEELKSEVVKKHPLG